MPKEGSWMAQTLQCISTECKSSPKVPVVTHSALYWEGAEECGAVVHILLHIHNTVRCAS